MLGLVLAAGALVSPDPVPRTDEAQVKVSGELRAEAVYRNHGLEKRPGVRVHPSMQWEIPYANLIASGTAPDDLEFGVGVDFVRKESDLVDYAFMTRWFSKIIGMSLGKMRVMQGGWDNESYADYKRHAVGIYAQNLVYVANAPMVAITLRAAGAVTLQVLNDKVVDADATEQWNQSTHLTWVLGWRGDFGPITPLLDVGSYDNNRSRWVDAGLKTEMNGLVATLDLFSKNDVKKYPVDGGTSVSRADVSTAITLNVAYEIKDLVTPWFYFSSFDDKQAVDSDVGLSNHTFNTTHQVDGQVAYDRWDDNGQVVAMGMNINVLAAGFTPFVALVTRSGKFEDQVKLGESQEKSEMWVRVGVMGEI